MRGCSGEAGWWELRVETLAWLGWGGGYQAGCLNRKETSRDSSPYEHVNHQKSLENADSDTVDLREGKRVCISKKFPGDPDAALP